MCEQAPMDKLNAIVERLDLAAAEIAALVEESRAQRGGMFGDMANIVRLHNPEGASDDK